MIDKTEFYFITFLCSAVLTAFFVFIAKKISVRYNLYDNPQNDNLKIHKKPISFLGGATMLGSFLICLFLIWAIKNKAGLTFENSKIIAIFTGSIIAWFYGFWDDTYWQERKKIAQEIKVLLQVPIVLTLALIFYNVQIRYQLFNFSLLDIALAALCFLFIENAVNLQDGLDGLAASVILISSLAFFIFFLFSQNILGALLAVSISGAIFSFLFFNWNPASIFMGNNGSYFLGFLMVVFAIMASSPTRFFYSLAPYFLVGFPIINVFYVFSVRLVEGRSIFQADREHIHDKLYGAKSSVSKSVLFICLIHLFFVATGLFFLLIH